MWFGWAGGRIYIYDRGQKVVNLRRNPRCTVLVDRNEKFPELQGTMMRGSARVLDTAEEDRNRRWIVFTPERTVTLDNRKLSRLR